jgi:hypothetical protein
MVTFRGDYVHGGTTYDKNHTRLFMGLHLINDGTAVITTWLEESANFLPMAIEEEPAVGKSMKMKAKKKYH